MKTEMQLDQSIALRVRVMQGLSLLNRAEQSWSKRQSYRASLFRQGLSTQSDVSTGRILGLERGRLMNSGFFGQNE